MKASVRWLRELCPRLPNDAKVIADRLTAAGLEVEASEEFGMAAEACLVARVVSTRPHPSRSGLRLVTVDAGKGPQEIVCGATNVPEPGGLVVLAPLGAHLPAMKLTVERRAIAGVFSDGLLCSEAELGLGDDGDGILILPPGTASSGARLFEALPGARDTILEIGVTPNRPDGLGHIGLAREAAALFAVPFLVSAPPSSERSRDEALTTHVNVTIEDGEACPHYAAAVLEDLRVAPSPLDVRWRLASLGVRAISNVVDVTNLVMLEFGHPMHAFDFDKVRGRAIIVRRARAGETLRTLDAVDRILSDQDLVIADGEGAVALAGVMGGGESEITNRTQRVLFECAYFDPRVVRRTARHHGLHTESSHRFERGVDWGDTRAALSRAIFLAANLSGGVALPVRVVEAKALARTTVTLRHDRLVALLGAPVEPAEGHAILERLGFSCRLSQPDSETWDAPSFRPDVAREVDLIEEVGRVRGYDAIPTTLPAIRASRDAGPKQSFARVAREAAVAMGLSEAIAFAFVGAKDLATVGAPAASVTLQNPLRDDQSVLRTSLLPGLLGALARARRHGQRDARLFTVGPLFLDPQGDLPEERLAMAVLIAGDRTPWLAKPGPVDVWDAKAVAEGLVSRIVRRQSTLTALSTSPDRPRALHPRGAAFIEVDGNRVGSLGPLHPDVADAFEIGDACNVVELDLAALQALGVPSLRFAPLPRFPPNTRDLAVVVPDDVFAGDIQRAAREAAGDLAEQVTLFDRFIGGNVPKDHTSFGLRVVYRASDRTLTDAEVDARHAEVVATVEKRFGATLRG